ncbi:MAG: hypothetical protein U0841_02630 [Chloroflexia bacterium]
MAQPQLRPLRRPRRGHRAGRRRSLRRGDRGPALPAAHEQPLLLARDLPGGAQRRARRGRRRRQEAHPRPDHARQTLHRQRQPAARDAAKDRQLPRRLAGGLPARRRARLRPLTRAVVAQQIGVHESTVSRATANKYVMLPNRQVIPFSDFFTPSLSTKDVIREFILKERAKGRPLTDREICDRLLLQGIRIARRTVAKYRAELGILPSTMR